MRDSFVFYSSFFNSINKAPEELRLALFEELCACGLEQKSVSDVEFPYSLFVTQAMASIDCAVKRYDKAVEDGKKGGRPRSWVDRAEAEAIYAETHSWAEVAEKLNINEKTLRGARWRWKQDDEQSGKNGKNLNINSNINFNENYNSNINGNCNSSLINNNITQKNRDDASAQRRAALSSLENREPPDGYEWSGGVQTSSDGKVHTRCIKNKITGEARLIYLD